jgi:DNA-binding PadR family transcriptional regulator
MAPNATRLLVLGVVRESGPVHGYDVRRQLLGWTADEWANIAPGSIYNALKTLVREEKLEIIGTGRHGARPERTTYRLTAAGEAEFQHLLRATLHQARLPNHPLLAALAFIPLIPRDELAAALRERAAELDARASADEAGARMITEGPGGIPLHVAESYRLGVALARAEATWARELADRLQADATE